MTAARHDVVAEARTWLGTPFHHQARVRGVGVDCAGLVIGVSRALDLVPATFDVTGYARQPDGRSLLALCDQHMRRVDQADMGPGDVLVLRWDHDPQHMGIVGDYLHGGLSLIHALGVPGDKRSRVVEHRLDLTVMIGGGRFVAAFRLPGVA
jgi:NlpC/P60 family putative phage cell wall peptidase